MELDNFYIKHKESCKQNFYSYLEKIPDDAICIDVGSNLGMYSETLLEFKPNVFIHMFEPIKNYYDYSINKLEKYNKNIKINNFGLSNNNEVKNIFMDTVDNCKNPGWNTFITEKAQQGMILEKTNLCTLNDYCKDNNITKIDFIKIDTEGYEAFVLEGFLKTLKNMEKKPYMYIELGWGNRHPNWDYSMKIFQELKNMGYKFPDLKNIKRTTDILFEPPL